MPPRSGQDHIRALLDDFNYSGNNRLISDENVRQFWKENQKRMPELSKLADVIFSIWSTEVLTERNFSTLSFVLNKYRNSLSAESLEEIMFVKLNEDLFFDA